MSTGWQLQQKAELQKDFTSGPIMLAVHYSEERHGGEDGGKRMGRPSRVIVSSAHRMLMLKIKIK